MFITSRSGTIKDDLRSFVNIVYFLTDQVNNMLLTSNHVTNLIKYWNQDVCGEITMIILRITGQTDRGKEGIRCFRGSGFGVRYPVFGIRCSVFGIRYPVFGIRYRYSVFGVQYSVFGVRYSVSGNQTDY